MKGPDGKGDPVDIQGGSPNALFRNGFTKESLPEGTEIIVEGYQAKDGANRAVVQSHLRQGRQAPVYGADSAPGANRRRKTITVNVF